MVVHNLLLKLNPTGYETVTVPLPAIACNEEDGGRAITLLMDMIRTEGAVLDKLFQTLLADTACGSMTFDTNVKLLRERAILAFTKPVATHRYANAWVDSVLNLLSTEKTASGTYLPAQGRMVLDYAHALHLAIKHLSETTYLKPEFLYQSKGTWQLMKKTETGNSLQVTVPTITTL